MNIFAGSSSSALGKRGRWLLDWISRSVTEKSVSVKSATVKSATAKSLAATLEWRTKVSLRSTVVGKGLFARKLFRKAQAIGHMKGKLITGDDYDPDYVVDMGDLGVLEPHAPFRYLNHSCEPNCELLEWDSKKAPYPQIWVHALRTVRPSEQLTIDYGWPAESAIPCLCGSPSCRGWVVDQTELERVRRRKGRARRAG
jgi:uncharacterized protein